MTSYVSSELRRLVAARAKLLCEYCLIHADDTYLSCQVDHIISAKHGGLTVAENLALACVFCNRSKGSDIGSLSSDGHYTRLFHPRIDRWNDHFQLQGAQILPCSTIGEATTRVLAFNLTPRLVERDELIRFGRYPSPPALSIILGH